MAEMHLTYVSRQLPPPSPLISNPPNTAKPSLIPPIPPLLPLHLLLRPLSHPLPQGSNRLSSLLHPVRPVLDLPLAAIGASMEGGLDGAAIEVLEIGGDGALIIGVGVRSGEAGIEGGYGAFGDYFEGRDCCRERVKAGGCGGGVVLGIDWATDGCGDGSLDWRAIDWRS